MVSEVKYNEYFGFTDSEVDQLYEKYTRNTREIHISREDLKKRDIFCNDRIWILKLREWESKNSE